MKTPLVLLTTESLLTPKEAEGIVDIIDGTLDTMLDSMWDEILMEDVTFWTTILRKLGQDHKATDWEAAFNDEQEPESSVCGYGAQ